MRSTSTRRCPCCPHCLRSRNPRMRPGRDVLEAYIAGFEVQSKLQGGVSEKHTAHGWHSEYGVRHVRRDCCSSKSAEARHAANADGVWHCGVRGERHSRESRHDDQTLARWNRGGERHHCRYAGTRGLGQQCGRHRRRIRSAAQFCDARRIQRAQIAETFGSPWNLVAKEIRIKPYPCCRWAHRPLDALLALMRANGVRPDDVESIECEVGAQVSKVMTYQVARTELQAKFCLPYCLAVAVCDGRSGHRSIHRKSHPGCSRPVARNTRQGHTPGRQKRVRDQHAVAVHGARASEERDRARTERRRRPRRPRKSDELRRYRG